MKQKFNESVKSKKKAICCHSGENLARSEALALSSNLNNFWTPASAGMTDIGIFYDFVNI